MAGSEAGRGLPGRVPALDPKIRGPVDEVGEAVTFTITSME